MWQSGFNFERNGVIVKELNVYLLPGMGADRRLYDPIDIQFGRLHYIEWEFQEEAKTMGDYAHILTSQITTDNNVYIGSSMGGMMAVEMEFAKPSERLILLSAPASRKEFPPLLNTVAGMRAGKWFSPRQLYRLNRLADSFMGFKNKEDRALFYDMLEGYGPDFLHFAVNAILDWDRKERPSDYLQVIGGNDALFKKKRMTSPVMIEGSGHFMTFEQPEALTDILNRELERIQERINQR